MPSKGRPIDGHSYNKKESGEKERVSTYEFVTQKIVEKMEQGEIPWKKPWKAQLPRNLITNKPYRGVNFLLLGSQDYSSPYWLTFKQAREKGGYVKKGEKGSIVTFWNSTPTLNSGDGLFRAMVLMPRGPRYGDTFTRKKMLERIMKAVLGFKPHSRSLYHSCVS